ncbi:MAG: N-acetylneuraminate synthase family protein [Spirochaetes bacterium]|nr:N-acetylneuraminate synthase family protein [Spirochaetota bacterium]
MKLDDIFKKDEVKIIAEIGINHNGNFETAEKMIVEAAKAGAHAVKFQTFDASVLYSPFADSLLKKKPPVKDDSLSDFFSRFMFSEEQIKKLKSVSDNNGIEFFSSPFDIQSVDILERTGVRVYKIASSEISNIPLLKKIASTGKPVLISTGISFEEEIDGAVEIFSNSNTDFALLHCVSLYPVSKEDVNLSRINTLRKKYKCAAGYSDHSSSIDYCVGAVYLGAEYIEKHFMLEGLECPDANVSITPAVIRNLITQISKIKTILGDGQLNYNKNEEVVANSARRSLYAASDMNAGDVIKVNDICVKRPGLGISPLNIDNITGKKLKNPVKKDMPFKFEDIE